MYSQNFEVKCGEIAEKLLKSAINVTITFLASMFGQLMGNMIWDKICKLREKNKKEQEQQVAVKEEVK